jgi:hypothetical protein
MDKTTFRRRTLLASAALATLPTALRAQSGG